MAVFTGIATAVASAIGVTAAAASTFIAVTAAVLQLAAGIAVSLIGKAMAGEPQKAKFGVQGQIQGGDDVPRSINFGWNTTAGSKAYQNEWGAGGTLTTRVVAIGDMPVRELVAAETNGSPVTVLWDQIGPYGAPVAEYRKGGKDHLWFKFYDGRQTAADPLLVGSVASAQRPYSARRIGRGIPYVVATSLAPERNDDEEKPLFSGFPSFKFTTYGARLYDVSKDSSAGGDGLQRWDDPSTWGGDGDFLPPVQIYNLLRGIRVSDQWLYGLQDLPAASLPASNWIAQINKARAGIDGVSGTEPTYRSGGEVQVGAPIHLAIEALLTSCQGRLVEVGGVYQIYVGEPDAPVMAFTDGDILSTEEQSFTPFYGLADTINGVDATYPNPNAGWNVQKAPPLFRPDLEAKDGNRRLMASVSLDFVPYAGQVQRLMKWALSEALRARRHTFVLGPEFRVIEPGDIVRWSSVRNGYVDKLFRVDGVVYKANLDVIVDLTEVDPSDYDWNQETDYRPVIDGVLNLVGPRPMPMSGWQVLPAIMFDDQGRARRPSIEVWYASGVSGVERVRVKVRVAGTDDPFFDGEIPYGDPWKTMLTGQFSADTAYEVRGIFVGPPLANWSDWLAVTTPDVRLGPLDVVYGDLDLDGLGEQIGGLLAWMGSNVRDLIEQAQAQAVLTGDQELANASQFDEMRRNLSTVVGDISASFNETVTTAIIPMNGKLVAVADALIQLGAGDGTDLNSIRIRYTAQTGPEGGSRIGLQAMQEVLGADIFRQAGLYVDVSNDPDVQPSIFLDAQRVVIGDLSSGASFTPFVFEDGEAKMMAARIAVIRSGRLESFDGKFLIDLDNKRISIST